MKKYFWMTALASVALAGCVSEEVAEVNKAQKGQLLTFGAPVMYNQSRSVSGEISGTTYPYNETFMVYGIEHTGPYAGWTASNVITDEENISFPKEPVEVTNGVEGQVHWYTAENYYLPADETHYLSFAAYSPARAKDHGGITYNGAGLTITNWRMQDNPSAQYDLMNSTVSANIKQAEVPIKFYHTLSSIYFSLSKAAGEGSPYSVQLKKLSIKGEILNQGTFTESLTGSDIAGDPEWGSLTKTDDAPEEYVLFSDEKEIPSEEDNNPVIVKDFLPIPQGVNSNMKVYIEYSIQQEEGGAVNNAQKEIPFTEFIQPNTTNSIQTWERANRYVYHIHFGALTKIFFAPTITKDWTVTDNAGIKVIGLTSDEGDTQNP